MNTIGDPDFGAPSESVRDSFGLKEVLLLLEEAEAETSEILEVLQDVLRDPLPDLKDLAAVNEYITLMNRVRRTAESLDVSSEVAERMRQEVEERLRQVGVQS